VPTQSSPQVVKPRFGPIEWGRGLQATQQFRQVTQQPEPSNAPNQGIRFARNDCIPWDLGARDARRACWRRRLSADPRAKQQQFSPESPSSNSEEAQYADAPVRVRPSSRRMPSPAGTENRQCREPQPDQPVHRAGAAAHRRPMSQSAPPAALPRQGAQLPVVTLTDSGSCTGG